MINYHGAALEDLRNPMAEKDPEMTANDVVEIAELFKQHHIDFYVDGGWGVDALLGEQTRTHSDLDIAIQHKDVAKIRALLEARGYQEDIKRYLATTRGNVTLSWAITGGIK